MHSSLSLFLLLAGFLASPSLSDPTESQGYSDCKPTSYRCGGSTFEISYPFRLQGAPPYCGHPKFDLTCADDTMLFTNIDDREYRVGSIDYTSRTFTLFELDLSLSDHPCPLPVTKTSFNSDLFNTSLFGYTESDYVLTVYYNCSPALVPLFNKLHQIPSTPCFADEDNGYQSFYRFQDEPSPPSMDVQAHCTSTVLVPVDKSAANNYLRKGQNDIWGAMKQGFGVFWKAGEGWCDKCTKSEGVCGNDPKTEDGMSCFCSNSSRSNGTSCVPLFNKGSNTSRNTIIGVGAGGVGFLILGCVLVIFLYNRRKKQRQSSSSNLLSRNTSTKMSSKRDPELGDGNYRTHIFSYHELEEATNGFNASRELGDGGFGTVYKGKLKDGRTVAVKRLYENNYRRLEQFMNEVDILSLLRHPNLVTLYGCTSRHSRELLLVYEFVSNGTLADHLHGALASKGALLWPTRMSIAIETADALAYLHAIEPQIIHRDVKTNNILLDSNFHVKVADFGLSRLFPLDATHVSTAPQGTPGYVDPEYHQCYQLTDKSDVYSFGVVLVELISSKPAVDISRHRHEINLSNMAINKIQNCQIDQLVDPDLGYQTHTEIKGMINQVAELAFRCLQPDRDMRPCIKEVLEVLNGIEGGGHNGDKEVEVTQVQAKEESRLLKNVSPFSPDTVTERWSSESTTPNTSG